MNREEAKELLSYLVQTRKIDEGFDPDRILNWFDEWKRTKQELAEINGGRV